MPIPVFLCDGCGEPLNEPAVNRSVVELFRSEGAGVWYSRSATELLPAGTQCRHCVAGISFTKEMDILDVWFESGASWHAVLDQNPELRRPPEDIPADLYTEGGDQHRGWFHSSLLTSVATRGHAPYRMVATSGWTLDEQGRAFSKSLGNGVDPVDIAKRLGGEIIRLWVASVDFREDVAASEPLMQRVSENYRKLRNTLRFLIGNLHDFVPGRHGVAWAALEPLDQYILARTAALNAKVRGAYDAFAFHRAYHAVNEFTNTDLSSLYLDVLKDRLYTFAADAPARRSAQTALWHIAETLTRLIAPILSFTADEAWEMLPQVNGREASVHLTLFPDLSGVIPSSTEALEGDWAGLLAVREAVMVELEQLRQQKIIGKGLDAHVNIAAPGELYGLLSRYRSSLPELLNVSLVELSRREDALAGEDLFASLSIVARHADGVRCERSWNYPGTVGQDPDYPTVCLRCAEALHAIGYPPYRSALEQP